MQTERDAPCPCGSGKKYKKCCLTKDVTEHFPMPIDEAYQAFQWLGGRVQRKLVDAYQQLSPIEVEASFRAFLANPLIDKQAFLDFQTTPAFRERVPELLDYMVLNALPMPNGAPLLEFGAASMSTDFDAEEWSALNRLRKGQLGIFQIEDLFPETHRVRARDILRDRIILIHDVKLSKSGPRFMILMGKVVYLPEIEAHILYTLSPFAIEPQQKPECLEQLRRCAETLESGSTQSSDWLQTLNSHPMTFYWLDIWLLHHACTASAGETSPLPDGVEKEAFPSALPLMEGDAIPQEALDQLQKRYIDDLYDQPIPALGNLTPAQAVKIPEFRSNVVEWLEAMEHHYSLGNSIMRRLNTDSLRSRLGL
jgi:SEC-C motif